MAAPLMVPLGIARLVLEVQSDGNPDPFIAAFQETWMKLPPVWRTRIIRYWRRPRRTKGEAARPRIVLRNRALEKAGRSNGKSPSIARVDRSGDRLDFISDYFRMPRSLCCGLIAHELAHVAMLSLGGSDSPSEIGDERQCDWICRAWNFEVDRIDDYLDLHVQRYVHGLPVWKQRAEKGRKGLSSRR